MNRRYLRLKACPRCKGDLLIDREMEGAEICIQCGYRRFLVEEPKQHKTVEKTKELKVKAGYKKQKRLTGSR